MGQVTSWVRGAGHENEISNLTVQTLLYQIRSTVLEREGGGAE